MKKIIFAIAFVACMAFVACKGTEAELPETDSVCNDSTMVDSINDTCMPDTLIVMDGE